MLLVMLLEEVLLLSLVLLRSLVGSRWCTIVLLLSLARLSLELLLSLHHGAAALTGAVALSEMPASLGLCQRHSWGDELAGLLGLVLVGRCRRHWDSVVEVVATARRRWDYASIEDSQFEEAKRQDSVALHQRSVLLHLVHRMRMPLELLALQLDRLLQLLDVRLLLHAMHLHCAQSVYAKVGFAEMGTRGKMAT